MYKKGLCIRQGSSVIKVRGRKFLVLRTGVVLGKYV